MSDEIKLLPCPFCGCADVDPFGWKSMDKSGPECERCGATAESVSQWNERHRPGLDAERIERAMQVWSAGLERVVVFTEQHLIAAKEHEQTLAETRLRRADLSRWFRDRKAEAEVACETAEEYKAMRSAIDQTMDEEWAKCDTRDRSTFDRCNHLNDEVSRANLDAVRQVVAILKGEA